MTTKKAARGQVTLPDMVVLSLLSEQPMHGYQLVSELEIREVRDWAAISRPQVYYSLNKLVKQRFVTEVKNADSSLGPERTKYTVNESGKMALKEGLSKDEWATQRSPPPFQTWMALSAHLPKGTIRKLFELRRKYLQTELDKERSTLASFGDATGAMVIAGKLMVELAIQIFETELMWLDSAQEQMLARS